MKTPFLRWVIGAALGIGCLILLIHLHPSNQRYYGQFDATLLGLTKDQVIQRVGQPSFIDEAEGMWFYQLGKNPGASLAFQDNKVYEVYPWPGSDRGPIEPIRKP